MGSPEEVAVFCAMGNRYWAVQLALQRRKRGATGCFGVKKNSHKFHFPFLEQQSPLGGRRKFFLIDLSRSYHICHFRGEGGGGGALHTAKLDFNCSCSPQLILQSPAFYARLRDPETSICVFGHCTEYELCSPSPKLNRATIHSA